MKPGSLFFRVLLVVLTLCVLPSIVVSGVALVTKAIPTTLNSAYDRNPSAVVYESAFWVFYARSDVDGIRGQEGFDPDAVTYSIYYKSASEPQSLTLADENLLSNPSSSDDRFVSAIVFDGNIYVLVSNDDPASGEGLTYYLYDGTSWSGPITLISSGTATGGRADITADADRMYLVWESSDGSSDLYTWDGATLGAKQNLDDGNRPKITLVENGTPELVVAVVDDATGDIRILTATPQVSPSFLSHSMAVASAGQTDFDLFDNETDLELVFSSQNNTSHQQLMLTRYMSGSSVWSSPVAITAGGYDNTEWFDQTPCGFFDGSDLHLLFSHEADGIVFSDAEITWLTMNWDLTKNHYCNIQNGITQAASGDTVQISPGLYEEQVVVDNNNFVLTGSGDGSDSTTSTIISAPTDLTHSFNLEGTDYYPVLSIEEVVNASISNLRIDGNYHGVGNSRFVGLAFYNSAGSIANVTITGVREAALSSTTTGIGALVASDLGQSLVVSVANLIVDDFQKTGVAFYGDGLTAFVSNMNITGLGSTDAVVQNGMEFGIGTAGAITDGRINSISYSPASVLANGILAYQASYVTIDGDVIIENCQAAVFFEETSGSIEGVTITSSTDDHAMGIGVVDFGNVAQKLSSENQILRVEPLIVQPDVSTTGRIEPTTVTIDGVQMFGVQAAQSAGVSVLAYADQIDVQVTNCVIDNWYLGAIADESGGVASLSINHSKIINNNYGYSAQTQAIQDAENNWWGSTSGPQNTPVNPHGQGDAVSINVDFQPWCNEDLTYCNFTVGPQTVFVDDDYFSSGVNGGHIWMYDAFPSVQQAVDAVGDNGTVFVQTGTYTEQVIINKSMIIAGLGDPMIIPPLAGLQPYTIDESSEMFYPIVFAYGGTIDGNNHVSGPDLISVQILDLTITSNNIATQSVTLGMMFRNCVSSNAYRNYVADFLPYMGSPRSAGILAYGSSIITIDSNFVDAFTWVGIGLMGDGGPAIDPSGTIIDNEVVGRGLVDETGHAQNGVMVSGGAVATIQSNLIYDMNYVPQADSASGITLESAGEGVIIRSNHVTDCEGSIIAKNTSDIQILDHNEFTNNEFMVFRLCSQVDIDSNTFSGNSEAVHLSNVATATVTGNLVTANELGIVISGLSSDLVVTSNTITNNYEAGLDVQQRDGHTPYSLSIAGNRIVGNSRGMSNQTTALINATGNWWGDASGPALTDPGGGIERVSELSPGGDEIFYTGGTGDTVEANIDYSPWWHDDYVDDDHSSPWTWHVDVSNGSQVQEPIDLAKVGDTILVEIGVYEGQLIIDKDSLQIIGSGNQANTAENTILRSPFILNHAFNTGTSQQPIWNKAAVSIENARGVSLSNCRISGGNRGNLNSRFVGVGFFNADGSLDSCRVTGIRCTPISGDQHGVGIYANHITGTDYSIQITDCTVDAFQKAGIVIVGDEINSTLTNCVVDGFGSTPIIAQIGIEIGYGATANLIGCQVTDIVYTGESYIGNGILILRADSVAIIGPGQVNNCQSHILFEESPGSVSGMIITAGGIANEEGISIRDYGIDKLPDETWPLLSLPMSEPFWEENLPLKTQPTNVTLSNVTLNGAYFTESYGIAAWALGDDVTVQAVACSLMHWSTGVVADADGAEVNVSINGSVIAENSNGAWTNSQIVLDFKNNDWGTSDGPLDVIGTDEAARGLCFSASTMKNEVAEMDAEVGLGNPVSEGIDYCPWNLGFCCIIRGDIDDSGAGPDITDLVFLVDFMFQGAEAPACGEATDINGSGEPIADISDLVYLVEYMFQSGPPPVPCL